MRKRAIGEELDEEGNEINTIYGDLITFIMILFIILFVLSYNEKKDEDFFVEMQLKFGAKQIQQEEVITTEELLVSNIQGYIEKEQLEEKTKVLVDEQKIKILLNPPVLFDSGKAEIKPQGKKLLEGFGDLLKDVKNPIIVEGHTDNIPINNYQFESNWELSFHRAYSVIKHFVKKYNFSPLQLSALGYGEYRPLVPNDSRANRAKNRRIEINIIRITEADAEKANVVADSLSTDY